MGTIYMAYMPCRKLKEGRYDARIIRVVEKTSLSGKPGCIITFEPIDEDGNVYEEISQWFSLIAKGDSSLEYKLMKTLKLSKKKAVDDCIGEYVGIDISERKDAGDFRFRISLIEEPEYEYDGNDTQDMLEEISESLDDEDEDDDDEEDDDEDDDLESDDETTSAKHTRRMGY